MVQAQPQLTTFSDFLTQTQAAEAYYELTNGELIEINLYRAMKLYKALKSLVGMRQIRLQGLALAMFGQTKHRYPDLTVLCPEHPEK